MGESLPLSLRAFPAPDAEKESLQYLIQRLNSQRGSFRNISEQSLEDEIQDGSAGEESNGRPEIVDDEQGQGDGITKKEEVAKARDEILKQATQALTETSTALEFVSLLLSKHAPAASQTTMSPFLKQTVPLGCLGVEVVQTPQVSELDKHTDEMVDIGSRMKSLNGVADSLLNSASRLEKEIVKETTYWEQVLAVKDKGWSLHRLPREKHTLGVRYGFAEAYSDFRDRGLAALRREEDGALSLDRGLRWKGDRKLRVRVFEEGKPIASNTESSATTTAFKSLEGEILSARNSIYDEELHHELDREARNLVNQGVRCIDGNVLLPYDANKQIEVSLVPREEVLSDERGGIDPIPDAIALSLRLLLSHAHHQSLQKRSQMPPPVRDNKAPRPVYALIKPILEQSQHQVHNHSTQAFLDEFCHTMKAAGLDISVVRTSTPDLDHLQNLAKEIKVSFLDSLLQNLTSPPHTSYTLVFPEQSTAIKVDTHTAFQPPYFGTTFQVACFSGKSEQNPNITSQPEQFTTTRAFQAHVCHVVILAIHQILLSQESDWEAGSTHDHSLTRKRTKQSQSGEDVVSLTLNRDHLDMVWRHSPTGQQATWTWSGEGSNVQGEKNDLITVFKRI
ncbi:RNA polymerase II mediator complex subunit [Lecanora helva]